MSLTVTKLEDAVKRLEAFLDMGHLAKFVADEFSSNIPKYHP
jgi:hypothetical protein